MKKKILVLGGTGFIGHNLLKRLNNNIYEAYSLSRKIPQKKFRIKNVNYIKCDISNKNEIKKKIDNNFDYVFNLSGNIDHQNKKQTLNSHYLGCKNLIRVLLKKKIKLFIQIGSSMEYGDITSPHKETDQCNPNSFYGSAKLKATKFIQKIYKKRKFPFIILRLYQIYGPHQKFDRLIPFVIKSELKKKKYKCTSGMQVRDFIYVDDLIDLFLIILKKNKINYGVYNVGCSKPIKVKNIINLIHNLIKKGRPVFDAHKMRRDERLKMYPRNTKLKSFFKWKVRTSLELGIKKTIRHYINTLI